MSPKSPLSVVFLTLNEEHHLAGAIDSVKEWVSEVFVVDSLSTDNTVTIALERGARVVQRPFTNYGDQWRWACRHLPIKTPWVMKLDADERVSELLREEIRLRLSQEPKENGYLIRVRVWFLGRPLRAVVRTCRLWRTGTGSFSDVIVNEHLRVDPPVGKLKGFIEHKDAPSLHDWWEKQNRYTTLEAIAQVRGDALSVQPRLFGTSLERRMFLKKMLFRVPFRYQLLWLYEVFGRGGWIAGGAALHWARLRVEVYRMRELKEREMRLRGVIPEPPRAACGTFDERVIASQLQQLVTEGPED